MTRAGDRRVHPDREFHMAGEKGSVERAGEVFWARKQTGDYHQEPDKSTLCSHHVLAEENKVRDVDHIINDIAHSIAIRIGEVDTIS